MLYLAPWNGWPASLAGHVALAAATPTRKILDFIALAPGHKAMMQFFRAGFDGGRYGPAVMAGVSP
jgi:hypothetical protein